MEASWKHLYVSDGYANTPVHGYSPGGRLMQSWGEPGIGSGQVNLLRNIWVAPDGWVPVAHRESERVKNFNPEGEVLDQWREEPSTTITNQVPISAEHHQARIA